MTEHNRLEIPQRMLLHDVYGMPVDIRRYQGVPTVNGSRVPGLTIEMGDGGLLASLNSAYATGHTVIGIDRNIKDVYGFSTLINSDINYSRLRQLMPHFKKKDVDYLTSVYFMLEKATPHRQIHAIGQSFEKLPKAAVADRVNWNYPEILELDGETNYALTAGFIMDTALPLLHESGELTILTENPALRDECVKSLCSHAIGSSRIEVRRLLPHQLAGTYAGIPIPISVYDQLLGIVSRYQIRYIK